MEVNMETYKKRIKNSSFNPNVSTYLVWWFRPICKVFAQKIGSEWTHLIIRSKKKFNIQNPQNNGLTIEMANLHEGLGLVKDPGS